MSRPLALPIRLFSQSTRQPSSTQCLRQRSAYAPLSGSNTHNQQQWRQQPSTRSFATSPSHLRQVMPKIKQPAQPSIQRTQREQQAALMRSGGMPDDIGLMNDTFILPRKPEERWSWRLRKKWLKIRFQETYSMVIFKLLLVKPRPQLDLFKVAPMAAQLHAQMYTLFADGNVNELEGKVCTGLFGSLRGRVVQRAPNTFLRWSIKKQIAAPKLCSFKAVTLPGAKGELNTERNAQIQAVVKLHTVQSLQHVKRVSKREGGVKGAIVTREQYISPEEEKESIEYVVVQRTIRKGKVGNWQVWGFTDETSLAQVEKDDAGK